MLLGLGLGGGAIFLFVAMRPLPVEVAAPARHVPVQIFGLGTVEARVISEVGFEAGGALAELNADQGDRVAEGALLARLHEAEQQARVAKARAGVLNAEAAVRRAEATLAKARAVLSQRRESNKRRQALVERGTVSVETAEEALMEEQVAGADVAVAISEVEVATAALEDAKADYRYETVVLDQHALKAPYDALVVQRRKELGSVLEPGAPLFTLVAPETVWTLAHVDEARAGEIRVGQGAEVRLRSLPSEVFGGHVVRIDIESDRVSEERRVYVACDRCPESFHLGEQAEVLITTVVLDEAILVPETAVEGFDGLRGSVWTVSDDELHRRDVVFGHRTLDSRLEIVEGLPEGALVVRALRSGLREGRKVRVLEAGAP